MNKRTYKILSAALAAGISVVFISAAQAGSPKNTEPDNAISKKILAEPSSQVSASADATVYPPPGMSQAQIEQGLKRIQEANALAEAGQMSLAEGDLNAAEGELSSALELDPINPDALAGLAQTLEKEGKNSQAISVYRTLLYPKPEWGTTKEQDPILRMHLALLLAGDGQWAEAVSVYQKTMNPQILGSSYKFFTVSFSPTDSKLALFQAMAHLVIGNAYTNRRESTEAFAEYTAALDKQPDIPVANYFYGYGWQDLAPRVQAQMLKTRPGQRAVVKAALEKATKMGTGELQKAAAQELAGLR